MMLVDLVEKWLHTAGPSPQGGAQLESLGFSIIKPAGVQHMKSFVKSWLNYDSPPINWFSLIYEDRIVVVQHGETVTLLAADPAFFDKLSKIMSHVINAVLCPQCKAEIDANYILDEND